MMYEQYPVFKGLQAPLQMFGLQGRFLVYAAVIVGVVILGYILLFAILGGWASFIITLLNATVGGIFFFVQFKKGLHSKSRNNFVNVYKSIYVNK